MIAVRNPHLYAACVVLSLFSASAQALIVADETVTCPIGGEKFTAQVAMSGTMFGQNLDRRPFGAIASPWPLRKCPGNGFVMYKDEFSDGDLARLAPHVLGDTYQALQREESDYYLAAHLKAFMGAPDDDIASTLLAATWEVQNDSRYTRYAGQALEAFEKLIAGGEASAEEKASYGQIAGELERRLGRFDAARSRFLALKEDPAVRNSDLAPLVEQELALIEAGDSASHRVEPPPGEEEP